MTEEQLKRHVESMRRYINDPVLFVRQVLGVSPDPWQEEALDALGNDPRNRVAVRSGHGVGKTAFESWSVWWFLFTRPHPRVPCTAPKREQLLDVLWPECAKWLAKSKDLKAFFEWQKTKIVNIEHPETWFAAARTATRPENLAGFHEDHLLFVVDEASGVEDPIYDTIEGALTTSDAKLLLCGNPTRTSGTFFDAFHKDRAMYWVRKVPVSESPRVDPKYRERLVKKYGEGSSVVRVRADGEFPKSEPDTFIPLELVENATMRDVEPVGVLNIGVDVARFGDDETVIAGAVGLCQIGMETYLKQDTMATAGWVIHHAREWMKRFGLITCTIRIDDDGVGGGVTDRVREVVNEKHLDIAVIDCHNGAKANDEDHYDNWGSEAWAHVRELLQEDEPSLIDDEDLVGQLSTRKFAMTSKGKIRLESKKDMKTRGLRSPDRADAVVLMFAEHEGAMPNLEAVAFGAERETARMDWD